MKLTKGMDFSLDARIKGLYLIKDEKKRKKDSLLERFLARISQSIKGINQ